MNNLARKIIWVISGTHWDREWRYTADQSLLRLTELVDDLLRILETNPEYHCFHLDGGTIVIEDYLAVRPENQPRLKALMKAGRVISVPWYTLPEMNTVAPEALVRNLLVGKRTADEYQGGMETGYTATSYGQISQLPQIYAGFGLSAAMTYRGTNKYQIPSICRWEGADGTQIYHIRCFDEVTRNNWFYFPHYELVLGKDPRDLRIAYQRETQPIHMADETLYEVAFQVKNENFQYNNDPEKIQAAIRHFIKVAGPQMIGNNVLGLDMEDNAIPYYLLPKLLEDMNAAQDEYEFRLAPLDDYVNACISAVKDSAEVPDYHGEMRYGAIIAGYNGLLGATHSSRVKLKLLNHQAERDLIAVAEPLSAMSALLGGEYMRSLLDRAWLELLKNHPHDSICGAALDEAHEDMLSRARATRQIARETSRKACEDIWQQLDTSASYHGDDLTLTFFNSTLAPRKGVTPAIIDTPITDFGDIYIEPCSGAGPILDGIDVDELITYNYFDIIDEAGNKIPHQVVEKEDIQIEAETKLDSNGVVYNLTRHRMLIDVDVPPMGYRTYALRPRKRQYIHDPQPGADRPLIATLEGTLENEFLRVTINPNGTFNLTDKTTGKHIPGMHYFSDNGTVGNAHQNKKPLRDFAVTSLGSNASITLVENNKLRACWRIDITMRIPAAADLDGRNRLHETVELPISSWITLRHGAKRLEIKTRLDNVARDHQLRVLFPADVMTSEVSVESAFDVVQRNMQWTVSADNHEGHFPFQPMLNFIDFSDGKAGLAFMSKGLREYEVIDDPRRTIAITLLRGHRAYMLANKGPMTPEEYERNTGQHALGKLEIEYAIMPHQGDWRSAGVKTASEDYTTPWRILQGVPNSGTTPLTQSLITITPTADVQLAAFCQSEDGAGYILRIWNSANEAITAELTTPLALINPHKVRLDESKKLEELQQQNGKWLIPLRAKEIATIRLK